MQAAMTEEEAIVTALAALEIDASEIEKRETYARRKERHMSLGKNRSGWIVSVPSGLPEGFEPDRIYVEIYDDTQEVYILPAM